jgi:hypothetical protein
MHIFGDSIDVKDETMLVGNYDTNVQLMLFDLRNPMQPTLSNEFSFLEHAKAQTVEEFDASYLDKINQMNTELVQNVQYPDDDNAPEVGSGVIVP